MSKRFVAQFVVPVAIVGSICMLPVGQNNLFAQQADAVKAVPDNQPPQDEQRIEKLTKLLTGSQWTGQFTTIEQDGRQRAPRNETYEISKAQKLPEGDLWMLTTRIKYGKRDVEVPLPINILWAGNTPVITVDQLLIPGLGTFDARVLIRGGKYSGTWTHNDHGGHLFGKIGKMKSEQPEPEANTD